jgi:dihydroflavonol-4-reductase
MLVKEMRSVPSDKTEAFVTGATGMLGSFLVERLLAAGMTVRAHARPSSNTDHLAKLRVNIVQTEPTDVCAIRQAMRGCDWVFHVAGHMTLGSAFEMSGGIQRYKEATLDLTELLLKASLETGVHRFLYVSSVSVYDPNAATPVQETAPLVPCSDYGRAKVLAEEMVTAFFQRGLATTIVRPCIIFGPRDRYLFPAAVKLVNLPLLPLPHAGRHLLDLVYVEDVAELLWQASQQDAAIGQVYNSASGHPLPLRESLRTLGCMLGRRPKIVALNAAVYRSLSALFRFYMSKCAAGLEAVFTPVGFDYMQRDVAFNIEKAWHDLSYHPRFTFREALALTMAESLQPMQKRAQ